MQFKALETHEAFGAIEDEFNAVMDESLSPRGPDMLYDLVGALGLTANALALDVGCGEGAYAIELARRFRFRVLGVDPALRHLALSAAALKEAAVSDPALAKLVSFQPGLVEALPFADASADLIWCRDVLSLVHNLEGAFREFRRVLRPGGHALTYQFLGTDRLEPREADELWVTMGCAPESMQSAFVERAIASAGLQIERCIDLGAEWGEYFQEQNGKPARKLLHAARLLRDPERYIRQFGSENYKIAFGDCLWHVYRMIGKLSGRVYVLSAPGALGGE